MVSDELFVGVNPTLQTGESQMMNKFLSTLIAALMFAAFGASAQAVNITLTKNGEYVIVESRDNNKVFPAVVAAFEKVGYSRHTTSDIPPGTKTDTWCKVNVYQERQILGECYTPQMGFGVSVRNILAYTTKDYKDIPFALTTLRFQHRLASRHLGVQTN
jgi:hypothetical protein